MSSSTLNKERLLIFAVFAFMAIIFVSLRRIREVTPPFTITKPTDPLYEDFKDVFTKKMLETHGSILNPNLSVSKAKKEYIRKYKNDMAEVLTAINYKIIFDGHDPKDLLCNNNVKEDIKNILATQSVLESCKLSYDNLESLKTVDLSGFTLSRTSDAFGIFKNVVKIILTDTGIRDGDLERLKCMPALKHIQADRNNLTLFPNLKGFKSLKMLNLEKNRIKSVGYPVVNYNDSVTVILRPESDRDVFETSPADNLVGERSVYTAIQ